VDPSDGEVFTTVNGERWNNGRPDTRTNAAKRVREVVTIDGEARRMVVDATGFWQVHREAPSLLASRVRALAGTGTVALDLYAGAGLLTAALEPSFERVISVESDADAVRAARRNHSQARNVAVTEGDVRATLRSTLADGSVGPVHVIVLDPPRSGAGGETVAALAAHQASRIVYVACDPVALARDTALLSKQGYSLVTAEAWDLFPMTHHVEAIAIFERA
jgi:tRNA/tmRNA/rRNA uracil-C5-methylase (TrmA/RlmC/RlmD family)